MNEKILELLDEKVNEVFYEMQTKLNIENGDVEPLDSFELNNYIGKLADKIEDILNKQKME